MSRSAHLDTFARDRLPPVAEQPEFIFNLPALRFTDRLNCATALLDRWITAGEGNRPSVHSREATWTYRDLQVRANQIAHVLVDDMALVPGNRVLLRGGNSPELAACWLAVVKAGGIDETTMPLLRARELTDIVTKAQIS